MTVVQKFSETVERFAECRAVVGRDGTFTYRELDRLSNGLAHKILPRKGEGRNFVVLILPRISLFPMAALGVLKAGATYVIVNPAYPPDRINSILEQTKPILTVTTSEILKERGFTLDLQPDRVVEIDRLKTDDLDTSAVDESTDDQVAMMFFTSGTTGKPKGVLHPMSGLMLIGKGVTGEAIPPGTRFAVIADLTFIISSFSLWGALLNGGECHIIDESLRMDMGRLAAYLNENRIERTFMGSSMGIAMLKTYDLGLKELCIGGEKAVGIPPEKAAKTTLINTYGMSEISVISMHRVTGDEGVIPAGRAAFGGRLYVLDGDMREVPAGTVGDIYASSGRLAVGYLGLPEQEAERFIANPFVPGERMIRTGDRGYLDANGELVLCGRSDNMVKLCGQRIETGEVEVVAMSFSGVENCACVVKAVNGTDRLCLFYEGPAPVDERAFRTHLAKKLAAYMLPTVCMWLEKLPRNARGKIDRAAMPDPSAVCRVEMVAPDSENERAVFDIAKALLGTDGFGVTDDLFAFGMSSLMAMRLVVEAGKARIRIKLTDLMQFRSIRATLHHGTSMIWWYDGYDPAKSTVLFAHGIVLTSDIDRKLRMWSRRHNVLVIEPIQEHYRYVFEGDVIDEVVALYFDLIDYLLPKDAVLKVCTGMSWGGKLAYLLAAKWADARGQRPVVVMGDTLAVTPKALEDQMRMDPDGDGQEKRNERVNESFVRRVRIVAQLERKGVNLPAYGGQTVLVHALKLPPFLEGFRNDENWRRFAPNLRVIPLENIHEEICLDNDAMAPFWEGIEEELG